MQKKHALFRRCARVNGPWTPMPYEVVEFLQSAYGPLAAIDDRPRPGKEPVITPEAKAHVFDQPLRPEIAVAQCGEPAGFLT